MEDFKFAIKLSIAFFIVGTLMLTMFYATLSPKIALIAYWYTSLAIVICWVYVGMLLFRLLQRKITMINMFKTFGVLSLNIPVALAYAQIMVFLLTFARITFKNSTNADIELLTVVGCEDREIRNLKKGDSKTVWIKISKDCHVDISYRANGEIKKETVAGYLTPTGGIKGTYEIGSNKDILDNI